MYRVTKRQLVPSEMEMLQYRQFQRVVMESDFVAVPEHESI